MEKVATIFGLAIGAIGLLVGLSALFALPVWWLWNVLCPDIFGLPTIGFMQAWGLNLLAGCLFGKITNFGTKNTS